MIHQSGVQKKKYVKLGVSDLSPTYISLTRPREAADEASEEESERDQELLGYPCLYIGLTDEKTFE